MVTRKFISDYCIAINIDDTEVVRMHVRGSLTRLLHDFDLTDRVRDLSRSCASLVGLLLQLSAVGCVTSVSGSYLMVLLAQRSRICIKSCRRHVT